MPLICFGVRPVEISMGVGLQSGPPKRIKTSHKIRRQHHKITPTSDEMLARIINMVCARFLLNFGITPKTRQKYDKPFIAKIKWFTICMISRMRLLINSLWIPGDFSMFYERRYIKTLPRPFVFFVYKKHDKSRWGCLNSHVENNVVFTAYFSKTDRIIGPPLIYIWMYF